MVTHAALPVPIMKPLPFLLCIDVEPDQRQVAGHPATDWSATLPCLQLLDQFRRDVGERTGKPVRVNWFVRIDPQLEQAYGDAGYACTRYASQWNAYRASGDEIGLHVHAWRAADDGSWVADHADSDWVRRCISTGIE